MATVTGLTAERMLSIEAAAVVDGDIDGNNLILTRHDGTQIDAGNVRGPAGPVGPIGSALSVLAAVPVLDVGMTGQIRAGRVLAATDFTNMGLNAPIGLWNFTNSLNDSSGNGRNLVAKGGGVVFDTGITGGVSGTGSSGWYPGVVGVGTYISDTGANDPFRIKTGSWGCWFKTSKRGNASSDYLLSKLNPAATDRGYALFIDGNNVLNAAIGLAGTPGAWNYAIGTRDVCDNRWHFAMATFDGTLLMVYLDGVLEVIASVVGTINPSAGPFNIGSYGADAGNNATSPHIGHVDEAFVTSDVLSEDEMRNLYCAKIPHTLGVIPSRISVNVSRRRRGAVLASADFPDPPLRLHNFSAGSLGDEGQNNIPVINNAGSISVAGADGSVGNAFSFAGAQSLSSTDAGLPAGTNTRSYGLWFKSVYTGATGAVLMGWGTTGTGHTVMYLSNGILSNGNAADTIAGVFVADGRWHLAVMTEENVTWDGIKRKLYVDGRLIASSTVLNPIVLAGAGRFRIGAAPDASSPIIAQVDSVFVINDALAPNQIGVLYAKSSQGLPGSPKNAGDHIEAMNLTDLLVLFDTLDSTARVDLGVAA